MNPDELLLVGKIVGPFGVKGQAKLQTITDRPDHLIRRVRTIYVGKKLATMRLTNIFEHKPKLLIVTLEGVTTPEGVDDLRGSEVFIRQQDAAPLREGEFFLHDLYGMEVVTDAGETIGPVREIIETGANEVLVVTRQGRPDALIPLVKAIVTDLDIPGRRITISPLPGLLD